jgi:hypothetical protein
MDWRRRAEMREMAPQPGDTPEQAAERRARYLASQPAPKPASHYTERLDALAAELVSLPASRELDAAADQLTRARHCVDEYARGALDEHYVARAVTSAERLKIQARGRFQALGPSGQMVDTWRER